MSTDSSRSSSSVGSGTIISSTTASTATGAIRWLARIGEAVGSAISQHQLFDAHEIREHFGHRAKEWGGNRLADLGGAKERLRERLVLDDGHAVRASLGADAKRDVIGALGEHDRRGHRLAPVL